MTGNPSRDGAKMAPVGRSEWARRRDHGEVEVKKFTSHQLVASSSNFLFLSLSDLGCLVWVPVQAKVGKLQRNNALPSGACLYLAPSSVFASSSSCLRQLSGISRT